METFVFDGKTFVPKITQRTFMCRECSLKTGVSNVDCLKMTSTGDAPCLSYKQDADGNIEDCASVDERAGYGIVLVELPKVEFKKGDTVKIVRKVTKEAGWGNGWVDGMDKHIGQSFVIKHISASGITGSCDGRFNMIYDFPPSSLELVTDAEPVFEKVTKVEFKVGDTVKVARKVTKEDGWVNGWSDDMDDFIGRVFKIGVISKYGIAEDKFSYDFPPSSLELVTEESPVLVEEESIVPDSREMFAKLCRKEVSYFDFEQWLKNTK